jgi:hypothetical protein
VLVPTIHAPFGSTTSGQPTVTPFEKLLARRAVDPSVGVTAEIERLHNANHVGRRLARDHGGR